PRSSVAQLPFRERRHSGRNLRRRWRHASRSRRPWPCTRNAPMRRQRYRWVLVAVCGWVGCQEGTTATPGVPPDVKAIVFLQRAARNEGMGNVFDYTGYKAGARLVKLEPPTADGKLTNLTADPMFAGADIMSWDLSFAAQMVVFSARL